MNQGPIKTRINQLRRSMSLTWAVVALSVGVIIPVIASTTVGIVLLALGDEDRETVLGVLVVCFAAAALGSALVVSLLLGRRARIARAQADFMANVTHELRTPLASIRMYTQTLQMGLLKDNPERTRESLETIARETEWLGAMIDRVLTWRAAAKDRLALDMTVAPLADTVERGVRRFERMVAPGDVELAVDIRSRRSVSHDEEGVGSLLLNLLINAYKYTGAKKSIRVSLRDMDDKVELAVEDNGIGIPERKISKIFEPFYRVDLSLRGKASGAGLGLAIVRHQARAHKGEVYVESTVGEGSRFSVRLPVAEGERDGEEADG